MNYKLKGDLRFHNEKRISVIRIRNSIAEELKQLGAQNIDYNNGEIVFYNTPWRLAVSTRMMSMVKAGRFEVHQNEHVVISYSYEVPVNLPVFAILLFILLGLFVNMLSFIGCLFVIFGVIINIISIKEKNNNFLSAIGKQIGSPYAN